MKKDFFTIDKSLEDVEKARQELVIRLQKKYKKEKKGSKNEQK